jgi:sialate O-acetylesterase
MSKMARKNRSTSSLTFFRTTCAAIIVVSTTTQFAHAALKLGSTFSDNMVLQRDQDVIVWGQAAPDEVVQIQLGSETSSASTDSSGHWKISLKPLPVGGPYTANITSGSESIHLNNILSGDVWLCSGQSNMQFGVGEDVEAEQMKMEAQTLPKLRLLSIPKFGADKPT